MVDGDGEFDSEIKTIVFFRDDFPYELLLIIVLRNSRNYSYQFDLLYGIHIST